MAKYYNGVPRLVASDIVIGTLSTSDGKHCLLGWLHHTAQQGHISYYKSWELIRQIIFGEFGTWSIPDFNDTYSPNRTTTARVWNEAMESLGLLPAQK